MNAVLEDARPASATADESYVAAHRQAHDAAVARWVAPHLPTLPRLECVAGAGDGVFRFWWDRVDWRPELECAYVGVQPDGLYVHENGHHLEEHCARWGPYSAGGGLLRVQRAFLAHHGADPALVEHAQIREIVAEHFASALVLGYQYDGYPQLRGLVPFRSAEDTLAFVRGIDEEAQGMAKMAPRTIAVQLDANGNTPPGGVIVSCDGLRPGYKAQGIATRDGFAGSELTIGDAIFVTDTETQAWGKLHVRGGSPANGTAYYVVSASQ